MTTINYEIITAIKNFAIENNILCHFNPYHYQYDNSKKDFYVLRKELVTLEKQYYITFVNDKGKLVINTSCFFVWDDTIDEEDSFWIDDKCIFQLEVGDNATVEEMVQQYTKKYRELCNTPTCAHFTN
jgi:hypothetical protein